MKLSLTSSRFTRRLLLLLAVVSCAMAAGAATLTGTVKNGTTGKPAAGDDVVLLALAQGMNEEARTKTDAQGHFRLEIQDTNAPHLVRVTHQGVNYFPQGGPIRPGTASVDIEVFDAAKKLDQVNASIQVMRLQSEDGVLQVTELYAVQNRSNPPRTLMSDRSFEIYLPEGAEIQQSAAAGPGGMPVNSAPVPAGEKGRYYFVFPLRPGETRFQLAYRLPYSGQAMIQPRAAGNLEHLAVLLPKSMQFEASQPGTYSPMADDSGQSTIQVATGVKPGQDLSFRISGTGVLADTAPAGEGEQQATGRDTRPGGGLGTPEGTPDPLHKYRWGILGGLAALLVIGGVYVASRSKATPARAAVAAQPPASAEPARSSVLLDALKEELFQLEVDRQQNRISGEEYEKAKTALDQTLQRALARRATGA